MDITYQHVCWSNGPKETAVRDRSPTRSAASSGLGPESPARTSDSGDYSPALSSIGCEPAVVVTIPVGENGKVPVLGVADSPAYVTFQESVGSVTRTDKDSICSSNYSSDEDGDDERREKVPKVPDGGWGWVVVVASFVISMVADGISFSFGLLYVEFIKHFQESKSKTSWIGSLFMAVPLLSGPLGSALVDRFGCRWMTIVGGLISASGFILSSFVDSIELMFFTFGVVSGLGLGLCYVTAVVCIAYWFDKRRTLATGLGACGTGVGTFVYAPLTQYLISEYGWRGTILLLAGTLLNMCVCGAIMRDPEWWTNEQSAGGGGKSIRGTSSCGSISGRSAVDGEFPGVDEIRNLLKSGQSPEYILTALATSIGTHSAGANTGELASNPPYSSVVNLPTFIRQSETVPLEVLEALSANRRVFTVILHNYPSILLCRSLSDSGKLNSAADYAVHTRVPVTMSMRVKKKPHAQPHPEDPAGAPLLPLRSRPPPRADSLTRFKKQFCSTMQPSHYLKGIRVHRNSVMYRGAMLNIHKYRLRASSCPDIYRNSMTTIARENEEKWYGDLQDLVRGMMDFSMFLELHFLLMSLSTILLFIWFIVPYFYLAEYMSHMEYSESQASLLLSIIGITNTIGMVLLGWAGDQPWMNVTKTYAACLCMCGLSTMTIPLCTTYPTLILASALFGLFFASSFSFTPVILVQLIPLERFTTAYGLILLCQGIGNLVGPPVAGWVFDVTHTWDLSFYLAGVWIAVSGVLIAVIPVTRNRKIWGSGLMEMEKEKEKEADNDKGSCA